MADPESGPTATVAGAWAYRPSMAWRRRLAVLVGGGAGSALRIGVDAAFTSGAGWPWATLTVNLTGALLLGYLLTRLQQAAATSTVSIPLLCTGVLGSYTTFSALSAETWLLWTGGRAEMAVGYAGVSMVGGLLVALVGIRSAERRP